MKDMLEEPFLHGPGIDSARYFDMIRLLLYDFDLIRTFPA